MITKKALVTTSSLIFSAVLLSQIYSFGKSYFAAPEINTAGFTYLAENIISLAEEKRPEEIAISKEEVITNDIIKVIEKEIARDIKKTRYALKPIQKSFERKTPASEKKIMVAAASLPAEVKIEIQTTNIQTTNEDLSVYEINNKGLVELYALNNEAVEYSKFEATTLASSYGEDIKDEVVVAQASTKETLTAPIEADEVKTIQPATAREEAADEDMVMFDYSDKKAEEPVAKSIDQKLYERPISNTVKEVINREIGSVPARKMVPMNTREPKNETTKIDNQEIDLNSEENIVYDYAKDKEQKLQEAASETNAFLAPQEVSTHETQFVIRAKEVNLNTQKIHQAHAFEFVPDYDRAERMDDQTSGEIALNYFLSGEMNTQTGVLQAQGMISTRVELSLGAMRGLEVPLINEEGMQNFLKKQGLSIEGNLLMIALDSSIVDTEIDSPWSQKFFFDKNFNVLADKNGAAFVLYAGTKSGNILLRYLLSNKESTQKIIYVGDGEMYFEDPSFTSATREMYTFTTRNLLGQKKKELVLDGSAISFFNSNTTAKKKALNAYEIKVPSLATGMRKYLEFKHLKDNIFVGLWNEKEVEVPGNDFIGKVLEVNQVSSLKDRCVVQINLSKDLRSISANGKNRSGEMFVETTFLDKDGNFSRESAEMAEKAFVVGDMEGQFNVKLDYTDGSTEFLKTFCSEGTYLVEQL